MHLISFLVSIFFTANEALERRSSIEKNNLLPCCIGRCVAGMRQASIANKKDYNHTKGVTPSLSNGSVEKIVLSIEGSREMTSLVQAAT